MSFLLWKRKQCFPSHTLPLSYTLLCRGQLKCDGKRAETRLRLSAKRTSRFKSAGPSIQSTTGSRGVRISRSNAGYTMFRGSVKSTGYPLHSPVSPSVLLPCFSVCLHISTGLYLSCWTIAYARRPSSIQGKNKKSGWPSINMKLYAFWLCLISSLTCTHYRRNACLEPPIKIELSATCVRLQYCKSYSRFDCCCSPLLPNCIFCSTQYTITLVRKLWYHNPNRCHGMNRKFVTLVLPQAVLQGLAVTTRSHVQITASSKQRCSIWPHISNITYLEHVIPFSVYGLAYLCCNIILNSVHQHNHFITQGSYKATCFDYRLVILRSILFQLCHKMLCKLWDPIVFTSMEYIKLNRLSLRAWRANSDSVDT